MQLTTHSRGPVYVVHPECQRLDAEVAFEFKQQMAEALRLTNGQRQDAQMSEPLGDTGVVLDLSAVQLIDTSGLGAIVSVLKAMGKTRHLTLAGVSENVRATFKLTRMDRVFVMADSVEEAVAAASSSKPPRPATR